MMKYIRIDTKIMTDLILPEHQDFIRIFAASYESTMSVDLVDTDAQNQFELLQYWPDRANKDKEAANKLHRSRKFEKAVEKYTTLIECLQNFISLMR